MQVISFDRGSWEKTAYSIKVYSFCLIMYDKNQYWYNAWMQHITNLNAIKDQCLYPGVSSDDIRILFVTI